MLSTPSSPTFTVVVCHFGGMFWIEQLTRRVAATVSEEVVPEILVVDQDRSPASTSALSVLPRVKRVVTYPRNERHFAVLGHDHPHVLNAAVREPFATTHVLIMDSDAMPVTAEWADVLRRELADTDCLLAADRSKWGLSHPCLMAIPVAACDFTDFAEGVDEVGIDTGRLVALQLVRKGWKVKLLSPSRGFSGRRGDVFLDGGIYHHGNGSFGSSSDERLIRQTDSRDDRYFRSLIEADCFTLGPFRRHVVIARRGARRFLPR